MELLIGFAIGMVYGGFLWWQALLQGNELYQEYLQLQRELMMTRRQLYVADRMRGCSWHELFEKTDNNPSLN